MGAGRPTKYKPEYAQQAAKLALMGISDEAMAFFFDVDLVEIALWAISFPEFFTAITPSEYEIEAYRHRIEAKSAKRRARRKAYMDANPSARVRAAVAARLWAALKGRSDGHLFSRLGYTVNELMSHLENRFASGMSWENYGDWHVDHKRPCALFDLTIAEQFAECWSLENLQPLWAEDNIRKGAKYAST